MPTEDAVGATAEEREAGERAAKAPKQEGEQIPEVLHHNCGLLSSTRCCCSLCTVTGCEACGEPEAPKQEGRDA